MPEKLVLSCFSGAGGMDLGLESAGFTSVGCIELDARARQTLTLNRDWPVLKVQDVVAAGETLLPGDLGLHPGELSLIAGGPPCQPFSMAAQWQKPRPGIDDDRGQTVFGMLNLVDRFLPQALLIENVSGFLRGKNSAAEAIQNRLTETNSRHGTSYALNHWILNAADFGAPQNRRRAIAVAFRDPLTMSVLPEPPAPFEGHPFTAWDAIGHLEPRIIPSPAGGYSDLLPSIPEGHNYQYLTARGGGDSVELFGYRTRYWSFLLKLRKDAPAWTLPASPGPSTGPFHWDNRPLALEERLALQGFPPDWKLDGEAREAVKLIGNATPPPLAEAMGSYISQILRSSRSRQTVEHLKVSMTPERKTSIPAPASPQALPSRWLGKVGSREAHAGSGHGPARHRMAV